PQLGTMTDDACDSVLPDGDEHRRVVDPTCGRPAAPYFGASAPRAATGNPAASTSPPSAETSLRNRRRLTLASTNVPSDEVSSDALRTCSIGAFMLSLPAVRPPA